MFNDGFFRCVKFELILDDPPTCSRYFRELRAREKLERDPLHRMRDSSRGNTLDKISICSFAMLTLIAW